MSNSAGSTETYTVLARRFRPQGFADVVGQDHVAQALKNAISGNRVAHAYLFTGARGVGKTSTARILAKALNCPNAVEGDPCNECEICDGISSGNDVDVLEIDGASNNGVDDIRQLRANVNVSSMRTQYKVYIIDEVHMLSKGAFNALLKTLEEPPPKVKFVFCTTEPNKVPDTILSRCQRFDFGTIETANIKGRLREIAAAEGVEVDDAALEIVARRAAGSMRDSQSLFDQLLAFGEEHIQADDVHRLLGTATDERLIQIVGNLIDRNQAASLAEFHQALDDGVQLGELTDQLLFYLRDLMILATGAQSVELLAVSPASRETLAQQADNWGLQTIVAAMQILADTKGRMQRVTYGRALAELALVRLGMLEDMTDLSGLVDKLRSAEPTSSEVSQKKTSVTVGNEISAAEIRDLRGPKPIQPTRETTTANSNSPGENVISNRPGTPEKLAATDSSTHPETSTHPTEQSSIQTTQPIALTTAVAEASPPGTETAFANEPSTPATLTAELQAQSATVTPDAESQSTSLSEAAIPEEREPVNLAVASVAQPVDSAEIAPKMDHSATNPGPEFAFTEENANAVWSQVVSEINDMLKTHVKTATKAAIFAPNRLEITFPKRYNFSKQYCEKPDALSRLEKIASKLTGQSVRISLVISDDPGEKSAAAARRKAAKTRTFKPEEDAFVAEVMQAFDAQCVKVSEIQIRTDSNVDD